MSRGAGTVLAGEAAADRPAAPFFWVGIIVKSPFSPPHIPPAAVVAPPLCVQRLGPSVERAASLAIAGPNRGRTVLPPLHDEGDAFVVGGGDSSAPRREHY